MNYEEKIEELAYELLERSHEPSFSDDTQGLAEALEWARKIANDLLPTRDEIADELSGWPIVANGYYQTSVATDEARDMADVVLDLLKGQDR